MNATLNNLLEQYKSKAPEIVFEWNDAPTGAKGWVVINSLRGGAAGGGTRMRLGLNKEEVVSLAKVMEVKFSVCGPSIGGAKSGINFDPADPRKDDVMRRWYAAVIPLLKHYYGTGGDLNIDELKDVVPITENLGLWHPQEGIVNGHLRLDKGGRLRALGQLRSGVAGKVTDPALTPDPKQHFAVADLITGYGVSESVRHFYELYHAQNLVGKRVIIQGWGNVAAAAGFYLAQAGAKIVGIIDRVGGVINPDGYTFEEVRELFLDKDGNKLRAAHMLSFEETNERIWSIGAEVFIPAAASKIVTRAQVDAMAAAGLQVVACGANVPFIDDEVFFGPTANYTDGIVSVIPDFISNCGMARVFAYLMQPNMDTEDTAIFADASATIRRALELVKATNPSDKHLSSTGLEIALKKLV